MSHITYSSFFSTTIIHWLPIPATPSPTLQPQQLISVSATNVTTKTTQTQAQAQAQMPIQTWMPTHMQLPSKCKHQCKCEYPHQVHVHEVSHNTCTSDPCEQLDASGSWRCQGLSVRQRASRVVQESPTLTSWGLLKGRSVPCSCLPSDFYVVGIPFYLKISLVNKEYILHCQWHKYSRTCKNKNKLN